MWRAGGRGRGLLLCDPLVLEPSFPSAGTSGSDPRAPSWGGWITPDPSCLQLLQEGGILVQDPSLRGHSLSRCPLPLPLQQPEAAFPKSSSPNPLPPVAPLPSTSPHLQQRECLPHPRVFPGFLVSGCVHTLEGAVVFHKALCSGEVQWHCRNKRLCLPFLGILCRLCPWQLSC